MTPRAARSCCQNRAGARDQATRCVCSQGLSDRLIIVKARGNKSRNPANRKERRAHLWQPSGRSGCKSKSPSDDRRLLGKVAVGFLFRVCHLRRGWGRGVVYDDGVIKQRRIITGSAGTRTALVVGIARPKRSRKRKEGIVIEVEDLKILLELDKEVVGNRTDLGARSSSRYVAARFPVWGLAWAILAEHEILALGIFSWIGALQGDRPADRHRIPRYRAQPECKTQSKCCHKPFHPSYPRAPHLRENSPMKGRRGGREVSGPAFGDQPSRAERLSRSRPVRIAPLRSRSRSSIRAAPDHTWRKRMPRYSSRTQMAGLIRRKWR